MHALAPPTPSKSSTKKAAPAPAPEEEEDGKTGGIQIVQDTLKDEVTGEAVEEIQVTFTGAGADALAGEGSEGLMGSDEQAREAVENARKLIESLKDEGVLSGSSSKRTRETDENLAEDEEEEEKPGMLKRWFGSSRKSKTRRQRPELGELQVMQSPDGAQVLVAQTAPPPQAAANRRRYIAMAGMVVMGAAT